MVLLNKIDLLPYTDFDLDSSDRMFEGEIPMLLFFPLSGRTAKGLEEWKNWLLGEVRRKKA